MELFKLIELFNINKPVTLEYNKEKDQEIIILQDEITINTPGNTPEDEFIELIARAKMAEDDPLLGTFFFQDNYTREEGRRMSNFANLNFPLQKAWTYRLIKEYAPELYEKEISDIIEMSSILCPDNKVDFESKEYCMMIDLYAILAQDKKNQIAVQVQYQEETDNRLDLYIERLGFYAKEDPSVGMYIKLAESFNPDYTVSIKEDNNFRFFNIKLKK